MQNYEIIISYKQQTEKKTKEVKLYYLVQDVEFLSACTRAGEDFVQRFPGIPYEIKKASESNIKDFIKDEAVMLGELKYYKCKVDFIVIVDAETGKEKKESIYYLVPAKSNKHANDVCISCIDKCGDYTINSVSKSDIILILK
jgi:hypothetical protein